MATTEKRKPTSDKDRDAGSDMSTPQNAQAHHSLRVGSHNISTGCSSRFTEPEAARKRGQERTVIFHAQSCLTETIATLRCNPYAAEIVEITEEAFRAALSSFQKCGTCVPEWSRLTFLIDARIATERVTVPR